MKTIEGLITELLFADSYALFTHTYIALQHIMNCFCDAAKNFSLTVSLKETEMLYKPPPWKACSPPHISINGTNLTAVEHFTYLVSVISSASTVNKGLDNHLSKASSSL